jgi:hypothetical protein
MLAFTVPWHEPWNDEAQAWLLSRDLSLPQLLLHNLRYESHPALWYLILWIPTHLHLPYFIFCWISAVIAAAGIYVLLRLSPFPFYLRAVLPSPFISPFSIPLWPAATFFFLCSVFSLHTPTGKQSHVLSCWRSCSHFSPTSAFMAL